MRQQRKKPLKFPALRIVSQRRLKRLLNTANGLVGIAENMEILAKTFDDYKDDLLGDIEAGAEIELGPIWDEIRRRRLLRIRGVGKRIREA